jgi:hypothetical protein
MNRSKLGRSVLTFVLVVGAIVSTAVDWNDTHLFNPAWHPHARFHDALFLLLLDGMTLLGLWLLWRPAREPRLGIDVAALMSVIIWTPFFYITTLIPGTSLLANDDVPVFHVAGLSAPPNVIVAGALLLLTALAYALARAASRDA